jgi:ABC-type uncharacterized transport system substrate-binding protein
MFGFRTRRLPRATCAILAGFLGSWPAVAQAHPHVFIKQHVAALFDRSGLTGFRLTWRFDPMYSSMMRADFVGSKDGPLTAADVKKLHDNCFADLKDEHYFTAVTFNGAPLPLGTPTDFSASSVDGDIVYSFVIPLKPDPGTLRPENQVEITVFDPSYYVYYELAADDPVVESGGAALGAQCGSKAVWRDSVGWGRVHSDVVACSYRSPSR